MNLLSKKIIEAIVRVETGCFEAEVSPPWVVMQSDSWFTDVRINSRISDDEIGLVMFAACLSSSVENSDEIIKNTSSETLEAFAAAWRIGLTGLTFRKAKAKFGRDTILNVR